MMSEQSKQLPTQQKRHHTPDETLQAMMTTHTMCAWRCQSFSILRMQPSFRVSDCHAMLYRHMAVHAARVYACTGRIAYTRYSVYNVQLYTPSLWSLTRIMASLHRPKLLGKRHGKASQLATLHLVTALIRAAIGCPYENELGVLAWIQAYTIATSDVSHTRSPDARPWFK